MFTPDGTVLGYGEDAGLYEELEVAPESEGVIWQLTPKGADEHAPGVVAMTPKELFLTGSMPSLDPNVGQEQPASVMSLVPASDGEATIYLRGDYVLKGEPEPAPAVLHYSDPSGNAPTISGVGWTAGGGETEDLGAGPCNLHAAYDEPVMLAGLSGSKPGFIALTFYREKEHGTEVRRAEVVEFGEGGSTNGCPTVPVTKPTQSYQGESTNEVKAGTELKITSVLGTEVQPAAGAKSVTWKVTGPETFEEPVSYGGEKQLPYVLTLDHTFNKAGTYEITDVVTTDDLADEIAQPEEGGKPVADKLTVTSGKLTITPKTPEPLEITAHEQEATLKAVAEVPGEAKLHIKKVVWNFGDGTKMESGSQEPASPATLEAKHTFNRCGSSKVTTCKVQVTVEAEVGGHIERLAEKSAGEIKVKENKAEEEAETPPTETTPTTTTPTTTTSTSTTPTTTTPTETTPKGGVAAYIASFSGSSLSVSTSGATSVKITCPSGGSCGGTLTLQTLNAVAASGKRHAKKKILALGSGSFSLTGGSKSVTLHLLCGAGSLAPLPWLAAGQAYDPFTRDRWSAEQHDDARRHAALGCHKGAQEVQTLNFTSCGGAFPERACEQYAKAMLRRCQHLVSCMLTYMRPQDRNIAHHRIVTSPSAPTATLHGQRGQMCSALADRTSALK